MKLFIIVLLLAFASCGSYRTLEGRGKPVYLTADSSVFKDTLYPVQTVWYRILCDLKGEGGESIELREEAISKAIIRRPTFFYKRVDQFLVYPGEHIIIKGGYDDFTFLTANGNSRRNRELLFFKTFHELQKYPYVPSILNASIDTILYFEKQQKDRIPKTEAAAQIIFDSLINAYGVSKKFKKLTKGYLRYNYDLSLNWVYKLYKDTLMAHRLYFEKFKQLLPAINGITKKSAFNANVLGVLNDVVVELFPGNRMWSMGDETMFRACFDSVENNFSSLARDYLLSRIMYRAYAIGLDVPFDYQEKYNRYSIDKAYRKIVKNTKKERERNDKDKKGGPNRLLEADGKTQLGLEELLAQHKGKFVLIDLWASWCGPCIEEMPYLKQFMGKYPEDKIIFLTLSVDKETANWHEAILKHHIQAWNNYLLMDAAKTSFYKQYNISAIPRYLLLDREGKVINAHTPSPSDPALSLLLDKLILE